MHSQVNEILNSVFEKEINEIFSVFQKVPLIEQIEIFQKDMTEIIDPSNLSSYSSIQEKSSQNNLFNFLEKLKLSTSHILDLKKDLYENLLKKIEICKKEFLEKKK